MNLKKRALHLAVTAGMVGSLVAVAAPSAHAAAILDDSCGVYLQGNVDPTGGLIPTGLIPFPVGGNAVGQKAYVLIGHESKGQDKILNDLNNTALKGTRFKLGVTIGGTITGNTTATGPVAPVLGNAVGSTSSVKIQWKNDANGLGPKVAQVQVAEKGATKPNISKGFVTAVPGTAESGAQIGVINDGNDGTAPGPIAGTPGPASGSSFGLYVPPAAAAGTFELSMTFPPNAGYIANLTFHSDPIDVATWGATPALQAATIADALNLPTGPVVPPDAPFGLLGGNVAVTPGPSAGTFVIDFATAGTPPGNISDLALPALAAPAADQTGALATTPADNGSLSNAWRNGGVDAGISPVTSLGNGVFTSSGLMASGDIPIIGQKNVGKWFTSPDVQYLFLQYPADLVSALVPGLGSATVAQALLQAIVGPNLTVTLDPCGLLGILGLFCTAASASIPPAFLGICGLL